MELWIRSQDKTILSKAQNIIIRKNQNENNEINYAIVDIYTMGIYKSKERALEVLDEIQKLINNDGYIDEEIYNQSTGCYHQKNIKVYEMPKE